MIIKCKYQYVERIKYIKSSILIRNISLPSKELSLIHKLNLNYNSKRDLQNSIEETIINNSNLYVTYKSDITYTLNHSDDHIEVLNTIIIKNVRGNGSIPLSSVFNQFIYYCTNTCKDPSLSMTIEESIEFLKDNLHNINLPIKEVYTYGSKNKQLVYTIDNINKISFNLPMICKPNNWIKISNDNSNAYLGGYLHNKSDIVTLRHNRSIINNNIIQIDNTYIDIINELQHTSYDVSSIIISYEHHLNEYRSLVKQLHGYKTIMINNDTKYNKRKYYDLYHSVIKPKHILLKAYLDLINIIESYNINKIYLTITVCFRGRIYTPGIISPTADKILRSNLKPYNTNEYDKFINLDATASMLQILSVITHSSKLAKITNLTSNRPTDTWLELFKELILNKDKEELSYSLKQYYIDKKDTGINIDDIYKTVNVIDRNITKRTIMRILYGSNAYQISQDLKKEYKINNLSYKHITLIIASFKSSYPYESECLDIIKILNKLEINHNKEGLRVNNKFIQYSNTYYKTNKPTLDFKDNSGKRRRVELNVVESDKIDTRKSNTASCPNLFHSLDSFVCIQTIRNFINNNLFIYTTHDSFRVNSRNIDELLITYNNNLFSLNDTITNLINNSLNKYNTPKNDINKLKLYNNSILNRKDSFIKLKDKIIKSKFTLSREYTTSTNNELIRHEINIPTNKYNTYDYFNMLNNEIQNIPVDKRYKIHVNIYSNHIYYIGGYTHKISTKLFRLVDFMTAINEFYAKFEHYGNDPSFIPIMQTIRFSKLDDDSLKTIKDIEIKLINLLDNKPSSMPKELFKELSMLLENPENIPSNKIDDRKVLNIVKNKIDSINTIENITTIKDNNNHNNKSKSKSKLDKSKSIYENVIKQIKVLSNIPSKERSIQNKKDMNRLKTLGRYYVNIKGFTKRFMSTTNNTATENNDNNWQHKIYKQASNRLKHKDNIQISKLFIKNIKNAFNQIKSTAIKNNENVENIKVPIETAEYIFKTTCDKFYKHKFIPTTNTREYNCKTDSLRRFLTADFETVVHNNKHFPFCGSISNNKFTRHAYIKTTILNKDLSNIEELSNDFLMLFWTKLKRLTNSYPKKVKKQVYLHNLNKFDGMFILKIISLLLDTEKIKPNNINIIHRNYVIYQIEIEDIIFRDSIQLIPGSLDSLAKTFGVGQKEKININFNYNSIKNDANSIIKYCNNDSELLRLILESFKIKFVQEFKFNPLNNITTSSLAFSILKRNYIQDRTIENTTNNDNLHNFIENTYRGGLSTVIKPISDEYNISLIDINSSYPFSMTKPLPIGRGMTLHKQEIHQINNNLTEINRTNEIKLFGFFDITIYVDSESKISPLVVKYNGKLTDANGNVRITIFSEEANFIMKNGGKILEVHAGILYNKSKYLKNFAEELYNKRKESKSKIENLLYKLILNSSYGRFALRQNNETMYISTKENMIEASKHAEISGESNIGNKHKIFNLHTFPNDKSNITIENKEVQNMINSPKRFNPHRAIQTASAITAYSRIELLSQAIKILDKGYDVFYVDTDSICTNLPKDKIIELGNISDKLGDWDIEKTNLKGIFIQPKFYLTESLDDNLSIKLKGIPSSALTQLKSNAWETFYSRYSGKPMNITFDKNFMRNLGEQSVMVKNGINYILAENDNFKRIKIYNNKGKWIDTKPITIKFNSNKRENKQYLLKLNVNSNLNTLGYITDINKLLDGFNLYINNLLRKLKNNACDINNNINIKFPSFKMAIHFLKLISINKLNSKVRAIFKFDNIISSTSYIEIPELIDVIGENEELYQDYPLEHIQIIPNIKENKHLKSLLSSLIHNILITIDTSELDINDIIFLLMDMRPIIEINNIDKLSSLLSSINNSINGMLNSSTNEILNKLNFNSSHIMYDRMRIFTIDSHINFDTIK